MASEDIKQLADQPYAYGFETMIETEQTAPGLSEEVVRIISAKKGEPSWLLDFRLKALAHFFSLLKENKLPRWAKLIINDINFDEIIYYSAPKHKPKLNSLDEVDPEILKTYEKLGIPLHEQKMLANVTVDAVFNSVSVATTFKAKLKETAALFGSF